MHSFSVSSVGYSMFYFQVLSWLRRQELYLHFRYPSKILYAKAHILLFAVDPKLEEFIFLGCGTV